MSEFKFKPGIYAFHVIRDVITGEQGVIATVEHGSAKVENRKFADTKRHMVGATRRTSVIAIDRFDSEDAFKEALADAERDWGIQGAEATS